MKKMIFQIVFNMFLIMVVGITLIGIFTSYDLLIIISSFVMLLFTFFVFLMFNDII